MTNSNNKLTLIKRSTPMCPACIKMQLALEGANISFDVIDITSEPEAVEKYNLSSVPVLLVGDGDDGYIRLNGIQPIEVVKELLMD